MKVSLFKLLSWWPTLMVGVVLYFVNVAIRTRNMQQSIKGNILCYYLNTNAYKSTKPEELDSTLCTHIAYAFVNMTQNGTLVPQNELLDVIRGTYLKVTALKKRNPQLKVVLSIGGVSAAIFSEVAASKVSRQNLVESSKQFLQKYDFDGIDVDWEQPHAKDRDNFVLLLKELKEELTKYNWILSAAVFPTPSAGYDVPKVSKYVDMLNLMTYNFYGPWSAYTGHNSPLYKSSIESAYEKKYLNADISVMNWIANGAMPEKINIGLAFYGRSYTLLDDERHGIHASFKKGQCKTYTFRQICATLSNWTTVWDEEQMVPYKYNGDQWLSYDDEKSIREKVNYAVANKLGGCMVWHLGGDDVSGECGPKQVLLRAVNEQMNNYP